MVWLAVVFWYLVCQHFTCFTLINCDCFWFILSHSPWPPNLYVSRMKKQPVHCVHCCRRVEITVYCEDTTHIKLHWITWGSPSLDLDPHPVFLLGNVLLSCAGRLPRLTSPAHGIILFGCEVGTYSGITQTAGSADLHNAQIDVRGEGSHDDSKHVALSSRLTARELLSWVLLLYIAPAAVTTMVSTRYFPASDFNCWALPRS